MGQFFLVTGTGKTGTTWLSEALNHPAAGIICLDEGKLGEPVKLREFLRKNRIVRRLWGRLSSKRSWIKSISSRFLGGSNWRDASEYEVKHGVGSRYCKYFGFIESQLDKYAAVGDSHSWEPHQIPDVNARVKVDKVIHLVRNGIPNVHALAVLNAQLYQNDPIFETQWRVNQELFGGSFTNAWEMWCLWWSINSRIPDWIRESLPDTQVEVFRLEDLTSDESFLNGILEGLVPGSSSKIEGLGAILHKNDDRDFTGDQSPEAIWNQWSSQQREDFHRICGDAMELYGYELP
jgi:hypothetical protein